jgi:UDP-N-acetylmuramoyl-tripeptide--D-alanyl-D-alanine ligase
MPNEVLQYVYQLFLESAGVNTDTRSIIPNQIYFALRGENFDGNDYIDVAFEKGASHVVVDSPWITASSRIIKVPDTFDFLQKLANHHRKLMPAKIIGLTGSNGKTTSKELMYSVLSKSFNVLATKGNLNNHIGLPLTLLQLNEQHTHAIIEMGASSVGEIDFLCKIAEPELGYITNYGKAHLEGFGSEEGIVIGKSELYDYLRRTGGMAIVNADDSRQMEKSEDVYRYTFSFKARSDFQLKKVKGSDGLLSVACKGVEIRSHLSGDYNLTNIAAAIALGHYLEMDIEDIAKGIESYIPQNNRSEVRQLGSNTIILDAYNANPTSIEMALRALAKRRGNKVAILGDMLELGKYSYDEHQRMIRLARELSINKIITVGPEFFRANVLRNIEQYSNTQECIEALAHLSIRNSNILIKGSRGMRLEKLLSVFEDNVDE